MKVKIESGIGETTIVLEPAEAVALYNALVHLTFVLPESTLTALVNALDDAEVA